MKQLLILVLLFATVITVFTGCGSSSSGPSPTSTPASTPAPSPVVVTYYCDIDGIVFSSGIVNSDGTQMSVGDNSSDVAMQSLVSFPLPLPAGATIQKATLRLYEFSNSNAHLTGDLLLEHLYVNFGAIDGKYFAGTPSGLTSCGEFSSLVIGWNEIDVTSSVQEDYTATRGKSQFRLYRTTLTDSDAEWDYNGFYTSENGTNKPELVITYTL